MIENIARHREAGEDAKTAAFRGASEIGFTAVAGDWDGRWTIVIARTALGRYRLLAGIPAGTVAGILLFVVAGGPVMLVTWLGAAAVAVLMSGRTPIPAAPATP